MRTWAGKVIDRVRSGNYLVRIGRVISELRGMANNFVLGEDFSESEYDLQELVEAYNSYPDREATLKKARSKWRIQWKKAFSD